MHPCDCSLNLFSVARSSRLEVFCKKGVLKKFAKFTGKHLCQISFLIKLLVDAYNFIKKKTLTQVFSCEFSRAFKITPFFIARLWQLLLHCGFPAFSSSTGNRVWLSLFTESGFILKPFQKLYWGNMFRLFFHLRNKQEMLRVVTIGMFCSTLTSL